MPGEEVTQVPLRVAIEHIQPALDCGRFPIKRIVGQTIVVTADVFSDGHDVVSATLRYRLAGAVAWREAPFTPLGNDAWRGEFVVDAVGRWEYVVEGWNDHFLTWLHDAQAF